MLSALRNNGGFSMSSRNHQDFLTRHRVGFPRPDSLAVRHAEFVPFHPGGGYFFSPTALELIDRLIESRDETALRFVRRLLFVDHGAS